MLLLLLLLRLLPLAPIMLLLSLLSLPLQPLPASLSAAAEAISLQQRIMAVNSANLLNADRLNRWHRVMLQLKQYVTVCVILQFIPSISTFAIYCTAVQCNLWYTATQYIEVCDILHCSTMQFVVYCIAVPWSLRYTALSTIQLVVYCIAVHWSLRYTALQYNAVCDILHRSTLQYVVYLFIYLFIYLFQQSMF